MAIKSETYPRTLQITLNESLNLDKENISIDFENSEIQIYNDRGGEITNDSDKDKLFIDNNNLLIGYLWETGKNIDESRFNIQDYYLFKFLVAINYKIDESTTKQFKLSFSTKKLLEASDTI